jgi:hypothetical protein
MSLFFFPLVPLFAVAVIVLVIIVLIRALAGAGNSNVGAGVPSLGVGTQLGDDGFWIHSCPFDPGSTLHYRYWSNGLQRAGRVPFQPGADGRQFVYTGERPERALIVQVDALSDAAGLVSPPIILTPPIIDAEGPFWGSSSDSGGSGLSPSSSGFPSAY